jgi:hypothetical protein
MLGYLRKMDRLTQLKEAQEAIDKQELLLSSTPDYQYDHYNGSGPIKKPNTVPAPYCFGSGLDEQAWRNLDIWWRATPSTALQVDVNGAYDNNPAVPSRQRESHNARHPRNVHGPSTINNGLLNHTNASRQHFANSWTGPPPPGLNTLPGQYPPSLHQRISIAPERSACPGCRIERQTRCPDCRNHWPSCPWQK